MSTVNFNDTVPAPPANFTNLKWQSDASGNISAYDPGAAWTSWTPTVVPGGSMTITTGPVFDYARWINRGGVTIDFAFRVTLTFGGTAYQEVYVNFPPTQPFDSFVYAGCGFYAGAGFGPLILQINKAKGFVLSQSTGTNFVLASSYQITAAGNYRSA